MRITLQIENVDRLETGGQVSYSCTDRGFDIGRHEHLDWSLPDPQRVISGKHCEVRFEDMQFVLYDISTNGTFINGSPNRMDKAHVLRSGDRLMIGDYIIAVSLEADERPAVARQSGPMASPISHAQPWDAPQQGTPSAAEPAWPSSSQPAPQAPSPAPGVDSAWTSPSVGMEGRHAPPSSAPGIGTPADDVWSQQDHGWGNADPSLYDPHSQPVERQHPQPAQADPMDHLAPQPQLQHPVATPSPGPTSEPQETRTVSPFPPLSGSDTPDAAEPMFKMPELGTPEPPAASDTSAQAPIPEAEAASPFPNAPPWTEPETSEGHTIEEERPATAEQGPIKPAAPMQADLPEPTVEADTAQRQEPSEPQHRTAETGDILKAFADGAGIPVSVLEGRDPKEFARELGSVLQEVTGDMMGLLQARSQVKAMTRNTNRTLISRSGNNALKFSPTPQMALQTMLSQNAEENGYLSMAKAMKSAFNDIQKHHVWTYAAMQKAAARFDETLSPKAIENEGQVSRRAFGNQKAKLWDRLQERWTSLAGAYDDGLVGVFTQYFTENYEELSSDDPEQTSGQAD